MSEDNIENLPSIEDYKDNSDELPSVEELITEQELPSVEAFVEKEEEDLNTRINFSPDNFNPVLEYMEEAKAYTAKIREYKDAKKTPEK